MKVTVLKKGAKRKLAGRYRSEGEVIEVGNREARVFCAVGFTSPEVKKQAKKKAKKKAAKKYQTRHMTAEK